MATGREPIVRHFRVFGCPAIFMRYEISDKGTRIKNKYLQQGMRGIFVKLPDDSAGWLFHVPSVEKTYISLDATFDEHFTSPLSIPDLPYQGAIKMRNNELGITNSEPLLEKQVVQLASRHFSQIIQVYRNQKLMHKLIILEIKML